MTQTIGDSEPPRDPPWTRRVPWRLVILIAAVAGLALAALLLPVQQAIGDLVRWTGQIGWVGPIALGVFYVAACLLMLPGSVLSIGAGAVFGLWVGVATVSVASTLGATAAFLVGRYLARGWVANKLTHRPRFRAIDQAVGREGLKIVLLTRLSPAFPFNLQNYAYGLTDVPLWKYVLGSWVGMLPGTVLYVYIGAVVLASLEAAAGRQKTPLEWALLGVGLVMTVVLTAMITRIARRALGDVKTDEASS